MQEKSQMPHPNIDVVGYWISIKDSKPEIDGNYLTHIQTSKYESIGFTQFIDGEFMSSFVTHWAVINKPCC